MSRIVLPPRGNIIKNLNVLLDPNFQDTFGREWAFAISGEIYGRSIWLGWLTDPTPIAFGEKDEAGRVIQRLGDVLHRAGQSIDGPRQDGLVYDVDTGLYSCKE